MVGLCRPGGGLLRRRRPTLGAVRLGRPISIGVEAFGHVCRMNSAWGGLRAGGWPAPTGRVSFASAEADARRGGCRMNSVWEGLRPVVGLCRPGGCLLRRRRPMPSAERL